MVMRIAPGDLHPRPPGFHEGLQVHAPLGAHEEPLAPTAPHQPQRRVRPAHTPPVRRRRGRRRRVRGRRRPAGRRRARTGSPPRGDRRAAVRTARASAPPRPGKPSRSPARERLHDPHDPAHRSGSWPSRACRPVRRAPPPAPGAGRCAPRRAGRRPSNRGLRPPPPPASGRGKLWPLAGGLGGDQDVDLALGHARDERPARPRGSSPCRRRRPPPAPGGTAPAPPPPGRSTPGPMAVSEPFA